MWTLKLKVILALVVAGVLSFGGYTYYIYNKGEKSAETKQVVRQFEHTEKVRKSYEKIDQQTPFGADESVMLEWLRQYTTAN